MSYIGNQPTTTAFVTDQFSGTGTQTAFTMSVAPASTTSVLVAVTGVLQDPSTYSVSGTTLTFSAAPPSGTGNISVRYLGIPASGVTTTAYRTVTEFTATAGQTTFSVPSYTVGYIDVYRNGSRLGSADYTATNGTTVELVDACTAGDLVVTESFYVSSVLNAIPNTAGAVTPSNLSGNAPQVTVYTSGSGTYTVPSYAKALWVRMVGGGGGGGGSNSGGNAGGGGNTTFGSALLTANGGAGGVAVGNGGAGGAASIGAGATGIAITGGYGGASGQPGSYISSGYGAASPFGGAGGFYIGAGPSASANSGSGGAGGAPQATAGYSGGGGGAGGYIDATITTLASSYAYSVGTAGTAGTAGVNGFAGGAGGSGVIIITAYF